MTRDMTLYLLLVLALPAVAGALAVAAGAVVAARCATDQRALVLRWGQAALAVGAPLAFALSFVAEVGPVSMPLTERWHALPFAAAAIACVALFVWWGRGHSAWWMQWLLVSVGLGALGWKFVVFPGSNPPMQLAFGGTIVVFGLLWSLVARDACSVGMSLMGAVVMSALAWLAVLAQFPSLAMCTLAAAGALGVGGVAVAITNMRAASARERALAIGSDAPAPAEASSEASTAASPPASTDAPAEPSAKNSCTAASPCDLVPWSATASTALAALACLVAFCGNSYNYGAVRPVHWIVLLSAPVFALLVCKPCLRGARPLVGVLWRVGLCAIVAGATILNAMASVERDVDADAGDPMNGLHGGDE